jgi:hypothetical protein
MKCIELGFDIRMCIFTIHVAMYAVYDYKACSSRKIATL